MITQELADQIMDLSGYVSSGVGLPSRYLMPELVSASDRYELIRRLEFISRTADRIAKDLKCNGVHDSVNAIFHCYYCSDLIDTMEGN